MNASVPGSGLRAGTTAVNRALPGPCCHACALAQPLSQHPCEVNLGRTWIISSILQVGKHRHRDVLRGTQGHTAWKQQLPLGSHPTTKLPLPSGPQFVCGTKGFDMAPLGHFQLQMLQVCKSPQISATFLRVTEKNSHLISICHMHCH